MTTKHTPGPWNVGGKRELLDKIIYGSDGFAITSCRDYCTYRKPAEIVANQKLIAAAPDLLAAAKTLLSNDENFTRENWGRLLMTVAKAEGRA